MNRGDMSVCQLTGITRPECSCTACLSELISEFRPALAEADPLGEITVSRGPGAVAPAADPQANRRQAA